MVERNNLFGQTPFEMKMARNLAQVTYKNLNFPKITDPGFHEAVKESVIQGSLREMVTHCCGIMELHGVQTLIREGNLERAVAAARAKAFSDSHTERERWEAIHGGHGPAGLLLASINNATPEQDAAMKAVGFTEVTSFYNTIWSSPLSHKVTLYMLFMNEQARTGKGDWRQEAFYKERLAMDKKRAA